MECLINLQHSFPQDFSEPNTSATFKKEIHIHGLGTKYSTDYQLKRFVFESKDTPNNFMD